MVNRAKAEIGVTLNTGGLLVSGQLASADVYWDQVAAVVKNAADEPAEDAADTLASLFRPSSDGDENPADDDFDPHHIHLRDALMWSGEKQFNLGMWRGRLVAVDGWSLGILGGS